MRTSLGAIVSLAPITDRKKLGDRFVVEREVGRGGAGIVYRAYDLLSERIVALKVIASEATKLQPGFMPPIGI